jgi:ribonuclease III
VLGWAVADLTYRRYGALAEGHLTDLRKAVVNATALAQIADEVALGEFILLGKGEDGAGGRRKPSILSDAFEAVIGAIYLDGGPDAAREFVTRLLGPRLEIAVGRLGVLDHKTSLQELATRLFDAAPVYAVREEGPDHSKEFFATVTIAGRSWGRGEGRSKKQAEQAAAEMARDALIEEASHTVAGNA